jgi:hypothetical protein
MTYPKTGVTGFQGEKSRTSSDRKSGGQHPSKAGTGYLTKSTTSSDGDRGSRPVPTDTGHATGIAKMKGGGSDSVKRKPDGVGGPLPSV